VTDLIGARNVGARVKRAEDPRILTGRGRYVDDVVLPGMLHGAFLRSTIPHGRLRRIDASGARALPGVTAVFTGEDMVSLSTPVRAGQTIGMNQVPGMKLPAVYGLAHDKVRFVGDPFALVVAESRSVAEDALELIDFDIEMLEPIVTYADALDPGKPPLFDELGDNIAFKGEMALGDVEGAFARADRVITASVSVHRHQPVPMEGRGSIGSWDAANGTLTFYTSTQSPHMVRQLLAPQIGVPMESIRVLSGDVGGGFGLKNSVFREDAAVAVASRALDRPVKWVEDRLEHLAAGGQAREEMADIEAAVTAEGVLLGLRMDNKLNAGAYPSDPFPGAMFVTSLSASFQGPTKIVGLSATSTSVFSNKGTYVSYRGPWATGDFLRERLLDIIGRELGLDPLEVRRRNYVIRGEEPLRMLTGQPYAGITTRECLDQAAAIVDWEGFRLHQQEARKQGRYLGIGIASYLEAAPGPKNPDGAPRGGGILGDETTHVWIERDGKVVVVTQQHPHGQGHQTTLAQVVSDELGVAFDDVEVRYGDTDFTPYALVATGGSRAATMANGAVLHASRELHARVLATAAELIEASPTDLEIVNGVVGVRGQPGSSMPLGELVRVAEEQPERLPAGTDTELKVTRTFDGGEGGWSGGTHVCEVEVDVETGMVHIDRYVVMEDCGLPVNPAIVEGQIRGGVTQAIGAVLLEHSVYDEDGQFLSSTFMDYLLPTTTEVPNFEIHHVDTVPLDPDVNFRGVGEGGMIVAPACIVNAIEDALAPLGVRAREQHLPPARLLELIGTIPSG
jgi:aerobic carbon-monoxide dehydrogenase large subunit